MANHKRGRSKNQRAGCLMCKYWKVNGAKHNRLPSHLRDIQDDIEEEEIEFTQNPYYPFLGPDKSEYDEEYKNWVEYLKEYNVK